jgi:hypothetical protein
MAKTIKREQEIAVILPPTLYKLPLYPPGALEYLMLKAELDFVKKKLAELEKGEKVIVLKEITREDAKEEIRKLFASGRTLYYSDIVEELDVDLELVVDICNELRKDKEIRVDADVS